MDNLNNEKISAVFCSTLELIKENGFHGTPMSKIAQESGVAIGTIYHYFPSKDELIYNLFKCCRKKLNDYIFSGMASHQSYKESFFEVWKNFVKFYIENDTIFSFFEQFYSSPYYEKNKLEIMEPCGGQNKVMDFLQAGVNNGQLKDVDVYILVVNYIGVALAAVNSIKFKDIDLNAGNIHQMVEIIWDGVKK